MSNEEVERIEWLVEKHQALCEARSMRSDIVEGLRFARRHVWLWGTLAWAFVGLFLIFAQDFAPLDERLDSIASRLEAVPAYLAQSRDRAVVPQVRAWQELEIESAADLPSFFEEVVRAGADLPEADQRRLGAAADAARTAIGEYGAWLNAFLPSGIGPLAAPPVVADRGDPKQSHLDGLSLSRAWCFAALGLRHTSAGWQVQPA